MKSLTHDNILFLLSILAGFLVSNGLLAYDFFFSKSIRTGELVGTLVYKNREVEQKAYGSALWNTIGQNDPVYNQETIRTSSQSSALIRLNDNSEVSLNEESMVFIKYEKEATKIDVIGGSIVVDSGDEALPVLLQTRSGTVSLKKGRVRVMDTGTGVQVQLQDGDATIRKDAATVRMSENSEYNMTTDSRAEFDVVPEYPGQDQIILTQNTDEKIPFSWSYTGTAPDRGGPPILTVARDALFGNIEYSREAAENPHSVPLGEGIHYWKLSSKSPVRWFTLLKAQPPVLLSPKDVVFSFFRQPPLVSFIWSREESAAMYRLEIFKAGDRESPVVRTTLADRILSVDTLEPGDYVWRIAALFGTVQTEIMSETASFSIRRDSLPAPVLTEKDRTVSYAAQMQGQPLVHWQPVANAEQYEVAITPEGDRNVDPETLRTGFNFLRPVAPLKQGTYHIEVCALSGESRSPPSGKGRIVITGIKPLRLTSPTSEEIIVPSEGSIRFAWEDPNQAALYRVVVSGDSRFEAILGEMETKTPTLEYEIPAGTEPVLFWKVQLIAPDRTAFAETGAGIVRLQPLLDRVVPLFPVNGEQIDINRNALIAFRWKPVENADSYVLSLYRLTGGLKTRLYSWETVNTEFILRDFSGLNIDKYSWDISARYGHASREYGAGRPATSFFSIVQKGSLPAPRKIKIRQGEAF